MDTLSELLIQGTTRVWSPLYGSPSIATRSQAYKLKSANLVPSRTRREIKCDVTRRAKREIRPRRPLAIESAPSLPPSLDNSVKQEPITHP